MQESLQSERTSSPTGRFRVGGVGSLSRRLMAVERAQALGRRSLGFRVWALEREAKSERRHRIQAGMTEHDNQCR